MTLYGVGDLYLKWFIAWTNIYLSKIRSQKKRYSEAFPPNGSWYFPLKFIRKVCFPIDKHFVTLRWRHNGLDGASNHQPHHCLLRRLFGPRSKKTPQLRVTGLCARNSPGTGEFPAQVASNAENVSIGWRHHEMWYGCSAAVTYILVDQLMSGTLLTDIDKL